MAVQHTINIAKDFSVVPAGRYLADGPASGEAFREQVLRPALEKYETLLIELDGTEGYGSSFLEESFGGLVRKNYISKAEAQRRIKIHASEEAYKHYQAAIYKYLENAKPE